MENTNVTFTVPVAGIDTLVKNRFAVPMPFILAGLCFFLVFCDFKCGDDKMASARGIQLVVGDSVETKSPFADALENLDETLGKSDETDFNQPKKQEIPANPWAAVAFVCAWLGAGLLFLPQRLGALGSAITGIAGFAGLLVLRSSAIEEAEAKLKMITVDFTFGFYLSLTCFAIGAILAFLRFWRMGVVAPAEQTEALAPQ